MPNSPSRFERTRCVRRGWRFERAGWVAMAVAALAGAAGLLGGSGVLSHAQGAAGADLTIRYLRFVRARAPHELVVQWRPSEATATLWVARSYLDSVAVQEILPSPESVAAGPDRIHYTFHAREPGTPLQVRFTTLPTRAGRVAGRIGAGEELDVEFRQFVFP